MWYQQGRDAACICPISVAVDDGEKASGRPIQLSKAWTTVKRIESDDGGGNSGTGWAGNLEQLEQSLNWLVPLDAGVLEEGEVGALRVSEREQAGEAEVVLHRY